MRRRAAPKVPQRSEPAFLPRWDGRSATRRVFAFVLGLSFVLLTIAFRSLVVPLKAIRLNLLIDATIVWGVLVPGR